MTTTDHTRIDATTIDDTTIDNTTIDNTTIDNTTIDNTTRAPRSAGAEVVGIGCLLVEGDAWRGALGDDAALVHALGEIPVFEPAPSGGWAPRA